MAIRVFTVGPEGIKPGARVQACIPVSGEPVSAILVGRDEDEPRFLPIAGLRLQDQKVKAPVEIQMVTLNEETAELRVRSKSAKADKGHAIVVFSAQSKEDAYYQVCSRAESQCGINKHLGFLKLDAHPPSYPQAHVVELLVEGVPFTIHARDAKGFHVDTYCWDGDRLRLLTRTSLNL